MASSGARRSFPGSRDTARLAVGREPIERFVRRIACRRVESACDSERKRTLNQRAEWSVKCKPMYKWMSEKTCSQDGFSEIQLIREE